MTDAEHLLTCLGEESVEIALDVSKALRFGLDDRNVLEATRHIVCVRKEYDHGAYDVIQGNNILASPNGL